MLINKSEDTPVARGYTVEVFVQLVAIEPAAADRAKAPYIEHAGDAAKLMLDVICNLEECFLSRIHLCRSYRLRLFLRLLGSLA